MLAIRITRDGFLEMNARLTRAEAVLRGAPERVAREGSFVVLAALTEEAPKRTGRLIRGFRAQVRGSTATFTSEASYTGIVISGTRSHEIVATNARALSWPGIRHPLRRVRHPGTRPDPFPQRAAAKARPLVTDIAHRVIEEALG